MKRDARTGASTGAIRPMLVVFGLGSAGLSAAGQVIEFSDPQIMSDFPGGEFAISADLNGDSWIDIVADTRDGIRVLLNDRGTGLVHAATLEGTRDVRALTVRDMDGDGHNDVVWLHFGENSVREVRIWYNDGTGRDGIIMVYPVSSRALEPMLIHDVNADGLPDVLYRQDSGLIGCLSNQGERSFDEAVAFAYGEVDYDVRAMCEGDFDNDGDMEIVAVYQYVFDYYNEKEGREARVLLLSGQDNGVLQLEADWRLNLLLDDAIVSRVAPGDLDGDGDLDLVVSASLDTRLRMPVEVRTLRNFGGAGFSHINSFQFGSGLAAALEIADLNADGRLDIAVACGFVEGVHTIRNLGHFEFDLQAPHPTGNAIGGDGAVALADLNGDGLREILVNGSSVLSAIENRTDPPGPRLGHEPLIRGELVTVGVSGAQPGDTVHFLYSLSGIGNSLGIRDLGGLTLDLRDPVAKFAEGVVGDTGRLDVLVHIPPSAPLGPVALQAVIRRGAGGTESVKSTVKASMIRD